MTPEPSTAHLAWGCAVETDPATGFPASTIVQHVQNCECPREDADGVRSIFLQRAHELHQSNVVEYMIPVVNNMARLAAIKIGVSLPKGIESLDAYQGKVHWSADGTCTEVIGRGFTAEEFEALYKLPRGQSLCSWVL
ncbi:hypothetical protein F5Y15DRAFT_377605 [Xylariaceae sp. FL0016]|nr:hypothetical protein F5Y15DRAFT_377605 [Xylariaceae sp. FL0016]